jgi:hypothetical protein
MLHSVDLPPLAPNADRFVGILVPGSLRNHWIVHRGPSKRVLPPLVRELSKVDIFLHNSLHTYRNVTQEFKTLTPALARPSAVIADDVGHNSAFPHWVREARAGYWAVLRESEKEQLFGIAVFPSHDARIDSHSGLI